MQKSRLILSLLHFSVLPASGLPLLPVFYRRNPAVHRYIKFTHNKCVAKAVTASYFYQNLQQ